MSLRELGANGFDETLARPEAMATRGTHPRFLAQPPLLPAVDFVLDHKDGLYSPVEQAIGIVTHATMSR